MIRFTASQWNAVRGKSMPWIIFGFAMVHLRDTEARPLQTASGRARIGCWACETVIEKGEAYRGLAMDRRQHLAAHEDCLKKVRKWANRQEKANLRRLRKKPVNLR